MTNQSVYTHMGARYSATMALASSFFSSTLFLRLSHFDFASWFLLNLSLLFSFIFHLPFSLSARVSSSKLSIDISNSVHELSLLLLLLYPA